MTTHTTNVNVPCTECGKPLIKPGEGYLDRLDVAAVCSGCGKTFSKPDLDAIVKKIGEAFRDHVADTIRRAFK